MNGTLYVDLVSYINSTKSIIIGEDAQNCGFSTFLCPGRPLNCGIDIQSLEIGKIRLGLIEPTIGHPIDNAVW